MRHPRKYETLWSEEAPAVLEAPEDVLSTMARDGTRRWIYPTESPGRFLTGRRITAWTLILLFFALPIIRIGGRPAVLLDLLNREFTLFGTTFYPTDTVLLMLLFIGTLVAIVLISALLGRAWCGWGCPQTVYLEFVFRPIERLVEGPEHRRKRRDEGGLSFDTAWRKSVKWLAYLSVSLVLAHGLVAYFVGWESLLHWMSQPPTRHWGYFLMMAITTGLVLFDFGNFREQMCTIACPYARFQSALLDRDSLIVSYDPVRGEPRGKLGKHASNGPALGDCIDCFACVRTCPVGIDIRGGLQMECVACTQCIDACDPIMDRIGKPRGLIRYTSENALEGKPTRILRPRVVLYGALTALLTVLFVGALLVREPIDLEVVRAPGAPFLELPDGEIANRLRFRVHNRTPADEALTLFAPIPRGASVRLVGVQPIEVEAGAMARFEAWVTAPRDAFAAGSVEAYFEFRFASGAVLTTTFTLLGPSPADAELSAIRFANP